MDDNGSYEDWKQFERQMRRNQLREIVHSASRRPIASVKELFDPERVAKLPVGKTLRIKLPDLPVGAVKIDG